MKQVNIHEAKTHLSKLLEEAMAGEEIIIAKTGQPMVRLVPVQATGGVRLGSMKGRLEVPDDFDDPLPDDILDLFNKPDF